jgi:hypothetical protein
MTDLVIKTCGGNYLVDMDATVIDKLKAKYDDYEIVEINPNYCGETRIRLKPPTGEHINHIEVDVPPGCYVVWTRVCHKGNDETNKVMVIVGCGDEACVNLLLNDVETCGREFIHPFLARAAELHIPKRDLGIAVKAIMNVAEMPKRQVIADLGLRAAEVEERKDEGLMKTIGKLMDIVKAVNVREEKE